MTPVCPNHFRISGILSGRKLSLPPANPCPCLTRGALEDAVFLCYSISSLNWHCLDVGTGSHFYPKCLVLVAAHIIVQEMCIKAWGQGEMAGIRTSKDPSHVDLSLKGSPVPLSFCVEHVGKMMTRVWWVFHDNSLLEATPHLVLCCLWTLVGASLEEVREPGYAIAAVPVTF